MMVSCLDKKKQDKYALAVSDLQHDARCHIILMQRIDAGGEETHRLMTFIWSLRQPQTCETEDRTEYCCLWHRWMADCCVAESSC